MALSQFAILNAKAKDKPYMLLDGAGLHLYIHTSGSKLWRMRFRFGGKANMLSLGSFPAITLAEARTKRDDVKKQIAAGIDPSLRRKLDKIGTANTNQNTFGAIAAELIGKLEANNAAPATITKTKWMVEDLAAPIANRPISEILPAELLDILLKIETSGRRDTAHRLRGVMGSVFRYAIATLRATTDPTYALRGALMKVKVKNRAAITDEKELGIFWSQLAEYDGWPVLNAALRFLVLTMSRPGEVRHMHRAEVDFDKKVWKIPAERMKMRRPHDVPLSRQAIKVLELMWPLNENCDLVFPSLRSHKKPLSENAFNSVLRNLGYTKDQATAHGFRSSASTILNERGYNSDHIEAALAHQDEDEIRRAYNRALYWKERVTLMQDWADLLDTFQPKTRLRLVAGTHS